MISLKKGLSACIAAATVASLFAPLAARAIGPSYTQDTTLQMPSTGISVRIMAGSQADSLTVNNDRFTVTVAAGEVFIVRYPGTTPGNLENDIGQPSCTVLTNRDNQLIVNGPRTATIVPNGLPCSTANAGTNQTTLFTLPVPNGGQPLTAGNSHQLFWSTTGQGAASVRLRLSTDGGSTYSTTIVSGLINNGFYLWNVPQMTTTTTARLKIEAVGAQSLIEAMAVTPSSFTINGTAPEPTPPAPQEPAPQTPAFVPETETALAASIDGNQGFDLAQKVDSPCIAGLRIKGKSNPAVYYCGADGKRHAFPNQRIHDSWFNGFVGVVTVTDETLALIPLGANVKYRPGVRMVKITSDPKVYAVARGGALRWVQTEASATALYGASWNTNIDDLSDAFFADYAIGDPVP